MKGIVQKFLVILLSLGSGQLWAQTYTYVVEEFNFTDSDYSSENGFNWQQFGISGQGTGTNEYATSHNGYLRYEGDDEASERSLSSGISSGKVHVYMTLAGFNLEMISSEETAENESAERSIAVQLVDNSSGTDVDIARLRFRADFSGGARAMRIGDDNSRTASTAGFPYDFHDTENSVTVGLTLDFDSETYAYWTDSPDKSDFSDWVDEKSERTGSFGTAIAGQGLTFNELELRIDHSGGAFGDSGEPRNTSNYFNLDRILVLHETTSAPSTATLATATEDEAVTISSNTTTTESVRVQGLTVNSGVTLTVAEGQELTVIDDLTINGTLVVEDGGSLKTYGDITGSITKERTTTFDSNDGRYSIVGSPVTSATTASLGGITYSYDESTAYGTGAQERFTKITSPETMTPGDGYFTANLGDASFTGTPNSDEVTVSLVYSVGEGSDAGWNCVANPFPAALELYSFATGNPDITGSIYIWDDGNSLTSQRTNSDYISVTASGTATAGSSRSGDFDGYIRSEQGFMVQATSAGTLVFNDVMKAGDASNTGGGYFRQETVEKSLLRVFLSNEESNSDMVLELNSNSSLGFDRLYDAKRLESGKALSIFSYTEDDSQLSIQAVPSLFDEIWLGVNIAEAGTYTLDFENAISSEESLLLKDHLTGDIVDLTVVSSYTFTTAGALIGAKRFSVGRSEYLLSVGEEIAENFFTAYFDNNELVILSRDQFSNASVTIHDLQGKEILNANNIQNDSREFRAPVNVDSKVLIVNFYNKGIKESIKLFK